MLCTIIYLIMQKAYSSTNINYTNANHFFLASLGTLFGAHNIDLFKRVDRWKTYSFTNSCLQMPTAAFPAPFFLMLEVPNFEGICVAFESEEKQESAFGKPEKACHKKRGSSLNQSLLSNAYNLFLV